MRKLSRRPIFRRSAGHSQSARRPAAQTRSTSSRGAASSTSGNHASSSSSARPAAQTGSNGQAKTTQGSQQSSPTGSISQNNQSAAGSKNQAPAAGSQAKGPDKTAQSSEAKNTSAKDDAAAEQKAGSILGSMFGAFGGSGSGSQAEKGKSQSAATGMLGKAQELMNKASMATKKFEFNPEERKKALAGLEALKKMAGKDGVLTPSDRGNIIGQMDRALTAEKNKTVSRIADGKIAEAKNNRGPLRKALFPNAPLVSKIGNKKKQEALRDPQHMNTARNQALSQLNQGFQDMGMKTNEPVSFQQGLQNARQMPAISMEDTNAFKDTMMMVRDKAKAMGLPEGKFEKGLPVAFLQDVLDGKQAAFLAKYQGQGLFGQ